MQRKKNTNNNPKKRFKTWMWFIFVGLTSILLGFIYLFFSSSRAYRVPESSNREETSPYLTHYLAQEIYNRSQEDAPFDLLIDQNKLNTALAQFQWPQYFGDISLADPVAVFGEGKIYVMGKFQYHEIATVITIAMAPEFSANQQLCLNIESIRLGQLPATPIVIKLAQQLLNHYRSELEQSNADVKAVEAIVNNDFFDAVIFPFDKPLKVINLSTEPGLLKVTLKPIQQ